jgi:hypothetical protein
MKKNMVLFTTWLNAEPGRAKLVTTAVLLALTVIALVAPGTMAAAGPATGGSGG